MNTSRSFLNACLLSGLICLVACQSEIDDKPAAEVTNPTPASETSTVASGESTIVEAIPDRSTIGWTGAKVTRDHKGGFRQFEARLTYLGDVPEKVDVDIDATSIWSDTERLTGHLKSEDFFHVEQFPMARFESTRIEPLDGGDAEGPTHRITGILEMHGVRKEITFPATVHQVPEGLHTAAEFTINRHDWGVSYRGAPDDLIRDEVLITLDLTFLRQESEA